MPTPTDNNELQLFVMRAGVIESETGQEAVDHFAADFQGLRHFATKIGETLELGDPWQGAFREPDYTLMFAYPSAGTGVEDDGRGGRVANRVPLFELLETIVNES